MSYNSEINRARNFKSASHFALVRFWNYPCDYSLNCTPLGPITITTTTTTNNNNNIIIKLLAKWHRSSGDKGTGGEIAEQWKLVVLRPPVPPLCKVDVQVFYVGNLLLKSWLQTQLVKKNDTEKSNPNAPQSIILLVCVPIHFPIPTWNHQTLLLRRGYTWRLFWRRLTRPFCQYLGDVLSNAKSLCLFP